jgi:dTDP-4-amino-4,6-dideoxygalactose transaminase
MSVLAIDGGSRIRQTPLATWPVFGSDEIEAATRVLASGRVNYWTGGECTAFEREFAAALGVKYAIALANGTVALELALKGLGIGPGDEVIVPSRTFIATASCAVAVGATPVVADIDPISGNLSAETIALAITERTRAVIPVHMAGWPCDMAPILELAVGHRLYVVEDCAQSHGASYHGRAAGSIGTCAAFSFCQDKIMTTAGEGGMLVTDDQELWRRAWEYKDHGKSWDAVYNRQHPQGFRWLHESFGTNWRMTEVQAAIGRCQLAKLPDWSDRRRRNADLLVAGMKDLPGLVIPRPGEGIRHAYYKFYAFLDQSRLRPGWTQTRIIEAVNAEGIPCMAGSCCEIYREQAFVAAGFGPKQPLPAAQGLSQSSLMFMVHPTLCDQDMADTVAALGKVMRVAAT